MDDFAGKVAIVTGSSSGIGRETAILLGSSGCRVAINYATSQADAEETAEAVRSGGGEPLLLQGDVSDSARVTEMINECADKWGSVDYLVNNAGTTTFVSHADLDALSVAIWRRTFDVNVIGTFLCIRAVAPFMRRKGKGSIVNISSLAAVRGTGSSVAYACSKGAVEVMTRALARALGPEIRINAVAPGMTQGRWLKSGYGEEKYDEMLIRAENTFPLRLAPKPEQVANVIRMLLSDTIITGEVVLADAGSHLV